MSEGDHAGQDAGEFNVSSWDEAYLTGMLEAILFAAVEPLNAATIADVIPDLMEAQVPLLVDALDRLYRDSGRGLTVQRVAGGWRLATDDRYADAVRSLLRGKVRNRLSRAALETISIIAYRQPISRGEVEEMRGVDSSQVLRHLLERQLIRVERRAEAPGRPLLYGTTDSFLAYFGLEDLSDLPKPEEILGDLEEAQGVELPMQQGPFSGSDPGVEQETYRSDKGLNGSSSSSESSDETGNQDPKT